MNLFVIFLTGLTTGGLSCLAVQGGLLSGVIANQKENKTVSLTYFLVFKLLSHTIFGFLLGYFGSSISLSLTTKLIFQSLAAIYMLITAANLLNLHPIFRYAVIKPPKIFHKKLKNTTPALLGFLTILVPCGVTQAMEVLAISSADPISGALIMFFFVLGTIPLFSLIGVVSMKPAFYKVAAILLIILSIKSLDGVLTVIDFPLTSQKLVQKVDYLLNAPDRAYAQAAPATIDNVVIDIQNSGYSPEYFRVAVGKPINLTLKTNNTYSCATSFVFKAFNISAQLKPNDSKTFTITPNKKGRFTYSCSMGMYQGVMEVI